MIGMERGVYRWRFPRIGLFTKEGPLSQIPYGPMSVGCDTFVVVTDGSVERDEKVIV